MQYTANQDAVMEALNQNLEEGTYYLPSVPKGTSPDESAKAMEANNGKPWATIAYHEALESNMGLNMFRGWAVNFISVWLLCWILLKFANLSFTNVLMTSLAVGLIGYFTVNYLNSIWFQENTIPDLIDMFINWGLVGVWLGWWLRR